jgi:hypothetical protein
MNSNAHLFVGSLLFALMAGSSAAGAQSLPDLLNALGSQAPVASPPPNARPVSRAAPSRRPVSIQRGAEGPHSAPARRKHPGRRSVDND